MAWHSLVEVGDVGDTGLLLLRGTGGLSVGAPQLTKIFDARVIVTSTSDDKLARAIGLGARKMVNCRSIPDWEAAVLDLRGSQGVDHTVELGGGGTVEKSMITKGLAAGLADRSALGRNSESGIDYGKVDQASGHLFGQPADV